MKDKEKLVSIIEKIDDKNVRVLDLSLEGDSDILGFWNYKAIYYKDGEMKTEHVIGKDMSDALYRLSVLIDLPKSSFMRYLENK